MILKGHFKKFSNLEIFPSRESWLYNNAPYIEIFVTSETTYTIVSSGVVNKVIMEVASANFLIQGSTFPVNLITTPTTALVFAPGNPILENTLSADGQLYNFTVDGNEYQIVFRK
jgi:hypothetical protein